MFYVVLVLNEHGMTVYREAVEVNPDDTVKEKIAEVFEVAGSGGEILP